MCPCARESWSCEMRAASTMPRSWPRHVAVRSYLTRSNCSQFKSLCCLRPSHCPSSPCARCWPQSLNNSTNHQRIGEQTRTGYCNVPPAPMRLLQTSTCLSAIMGWVSPVASNRSAVHRSHPHCRSMHAKPARGVHCAPDHVAAAELILRKRPKVPVRMP